MGGGNDLPRNCPDHCPVLSDFRHASMLYKSVKKKEKKRKEKKRNVQARRKKLFIRATYSGFRTQCKKKKKKKKETKETKFIFYRVRKKEKKKKQKKCHYN